MHNRVEVAAAAEVRQPLPCLPAVQVRPLGTVVLIHTLAGATVVVHDNLEILVDSTVGVAIFVELYLVVVQEVLVFVDCAGHASLVGEESGQPCPLRDDPWWLQNLSPYHCTRVHQFSCTPTILLHLAVFKMVATQSGLRCQCFLIVLLVHSPFVVSCASDS